MTLESLVVDLRDRGVVIALAHGRVSLKPLSLITDAERDYLAEHRSELHALLSPVPEPQPEPPAPEPPASVPTVKTRPEPTDADVMSGRAVHRRQRDGSWAVEWSTPIRGTVGHPATPFELPGRGVEDPTTVQDVTRRPQGPARFR